MTPAPEEIEVVCPHCFRGWSVPSEQASAIKVRGRCISCHPEFEGDDEAKIMIDRYGMDESDWPESMTKTMRALATGYNAMIQAASPDKKVG